MKLDRSGKRTTLLFLNLLYHYLLLYEVVVSFLSLEVFPFILRLYFEKCNKVLQLNGLNMSFMRSKYY